MKEIKFRIYFEADEDEPAWMSEPITLLDLLHGEDIEFRNEEDTVSLPLNDFRFFYKPNEKYKIMQYTGLKDKNGKKIYESDVVEITRQCIFERGLVIFKNGCFFIKVRETLLPLYECEINKFKLKVIGNKFNNPELLEKGKE